MTSSLQLKALSNEQIAIANALYCAPLTVETPLLGYQWKWRFMPASAIGDYPIRIGADWGNARVMLRGSAIWFERLVSPLLANVAFVTLPQSLKMAVAQAAFTEIAEQVEISSGLSFRIASIELNDLQGILPADIQNFYVMKWQASAAGLEYGGELWIDRTAEEYLSKCRFDRKSLSGNVRSFSKVPIPLRLQIGETTLPSATYRTLSQNDVVLLDYCWIVKNELLIVLPGSTNAFKANLEETKLIVTKGLIKIMGDPEFDDQDELSITEARSLSELPLKLTFDLGDRTIELGELQSIEPGYVFDLGRDLRQAVIIRANGMRVGEGELVDISGRTGVLLTSLDGTKS